MNNSQEITRRGIKKRFISVLFKVMLSCLFFLFLFELFARLFIFGLGGLSISTINSTAHIGVSGLIQASSSKEIVFELKPNLNTIFKLVALVTNSSG